MERPVHSMNHLFAQLGEPSDDAAIERFIETHRLADGIALYEAPFWKPAQAAFLREALLDDADWAEIADELSSELRIRH